MLFPKNRSWFLKASTNLRCLEHESFTKAWKFPKTCARWMFGFSNVFPFSQSKSMFNIKIQHFLKQQYYELKLLIFIIVIYTILKTFLIPLHEMNTLFSYKLLHNFNFKLKRFNQMEKIYKVSRVSVSIPSPFLFIQYN